MDQEELCGYCGLLQKYAAAPQNRRRADLIDARIVKSWRQLVESPCPLCCIFRDSIQARGILEDDIITVADPLPDAESDDNPNLPLNMNLNLRGQGIVHLQLFSHPGKLCIRLHSDNSAIRPALLTLPPRCTLSLECHALRAHHKSNLAAGMAR